MSAELCRVWEKAFLYFAISSPWAARKVADNFCTCRLRMVKDVSSTWEQKSPIFICVVKDDLERIKMSYAHHREIGIKQFVFLDNGSTDGTFEWLREQEAVVLQTEDRFIQWAKIAWVSKIISHFGFDRWYLIVDSDELFVYPHCEETPISDYIANLEQTHRTRDLSFMLDMYSDKPLFDEVDPDRSIRSNFRYFDTDSYIMTNCLHYRKIVGGPRERLFAEKGGMEMLQNKYPLVYLKRGDVYRYHYVSPYRDNFTTCCTSTLLHYKFLNGDYEKYMKIANEGNYANGSRLYKTIVSKVSSQSGLCFWNEHSAEYQDSVDLLKNRLINDWKGN
jgi:hypothetical protein